MLHAPTTCRTCALWDCPDESRDYAIEAPCPTRDTDTAATDWCEMHDALKVMEAADG